MKRQVYEFFVAGYMDGDAFRVVGRCGDIPIRVGDVFDAMYRYKPYKDLGPDEDPIRHKEMPASIRVLAINAINRDLPMLGQGMTGALTVEGEGIEDITSGWVLGLRSDAAVERNGHAAGVVDAESTVSTAP